MFVKTGLRPRAWKARRRLVRVGVAVEVGALVVDLRPRLRHPTGRFFPEYERWRNLARGVSLAIGGAGAGAKLAKRIGAAYLPGDPVAAAARAAART